MGIKGDGEEKKIDMTGVLYKHSPAHKQIEMYKNNCHHQS